MYQIVVGEGGCDPAYFMDRMSVDEAQDYITGLRMRYRSGWEQARMMATVLHKVETGKDLEIKYAWDEAEEKEQTSKADLERLRKKAKEMEMMMNKHKNREKEDESENTER